MGIDYQSSEAVADTLIAKTAAEITERSMVALREAIKSAMTINGAAAVAVLGYMGGVASKGAVTGVIQVPRLQVPLLFFALGVLFSAATFVALHFYEERDLDRFHIAIQERKKISTEDKRYRKIALRCIGGSLLSFTVGCVLTAVSL